MILRRRFLRQQLKISSEQILSRPLTVNISDLSINKTSLFAVMCSKFGRESADQRYKTKTMEKAEDRTKDNTEI